MRFHCVNVLTFYRHGHVIDAFHANMFHGTAMRGGAFPSATNARVAFDVDRPLKLHKNAFRMADVFAPEFNLVVSERVRKSLQEIGGLVFEAVEFTVLYSWPCHENDFSHFQTIGDYKQQQDWISSRADESSLHSSVSKHFHLVAPPIREVRKMLPNLKSVEIPGGANNETHSKTIEVGPELATEYPIHSSGGFVMTDELFGHLSPYIVWTYFRHRSVEL